MRRSQPRAAVHAIIGVLVALVSASVGQADGSDEMSVAIIWSGKQYCDAHSPGFRVQAAPGYAKWREKHKKTIAQLESGPRQPVSPPPSIEQESELDPHCQVLLEVLADQLRTPDPRHSTPEGTWSHFLSSLRVGDKSGVMSCFEPSSRPMYAPRFNAMTPAQMTAFAENIEEFALTTVRYDPYWEGVVVTRSKTMYTVTFVRDEMGWRIASM